MNCRKLLLAVLVLAAAQAAATTLTVRKDGTGDFAVIQQALDVAADGDTVRIGPGEYTESTMVRLPGWGSDIESFAHLRCDNLTLIGAGSDATVIGPTTFQGGAGTGSPVGLSYSMNGGFLQVSDLNIHNCYAGVYIAGKLQMNRCNIVDNRLGVGWDPSGPGGWIRDSDFDVAAPILDPWAFDIGNGGLGSNIDLARCRFGSPALIRSTLGIAIQDCALKGLGLYSGTQASVYRCKLVGANVGISQSLGSGTYCEVYDSELDGSYAALSVTGTALGGRFVVENSRLVGGSHGVLWSGNGAGACIIHNCDFVKGSGPMVQCDISAVAVTHDLRNNYWGTTSEADIQAWIIDHNDHPNYGATVLYAPFAGQSVPAETTTWGELKALFR